MANVIDFLAILIIVLATLGCCLRGFVKTVIGVAGTVVAVILAVTIGLASYESVYNNFFKDSAKEMAQNFVEQVDAGAIIGDVLKENGVSGELDSKELNKAIAQEGDMGRNVQVYLDKKGIKSEKSASKIIDEFVEKPNVSDETLAKYNIDRESFNKVVKESGDKLKEALRAAAEEDKSKAADYLEEKVLAPIMKRVVRDFLIVIIFVVLKIIISIIIVASGVIDRFDLIKKTDMMLGALLGFFCGTITVVVYAYAMHVFIKTTGGGITPVTSEVVESTFFFSLFYKFFG
ncbi:MAG: CvpA family protein [Ruminococcus sp.]|nr:CvpA family protein [Ruminococcus sp.]